MQILLFDPAGAGAIIRLTMLAYIEPAAAHQAPPRP
jgi:hypothetical protein